MLEGSRSAASAHHAVAAGPPVGRILSNEWACVQGVDWTASQTTLGPVRTEAHEGGNA